MTITWLKRDHLILWLNQQAHALHGIVEIHWHFVTWTNESLFTSLGAFLGDFKDVLGLDTVVEVYPFFEDVVFLYYVNFNKKYLRGGEWIHGRTSLLERCQWSNQDGFGNLGNSLPRVEP
jgi:hypothetical protein